MTHPEQDHQPRSDRAHDLAIDRHRRGAHALDQGSQSRRLANYAAFKRSRYRL